MLWGLTCSISIMILSTSRYQSIWSVANMIEFEAFSAHMRKQRARQSIFMSYRRGRRLSFQFVATITINARSRLRCPKFGFFRGRWYCYLGGDHWPSFPSVYSPPVFTSELVWVGLMFSKTAPYTYYSGRAPWYCIRCWTFTSAAISLGQGCPAPVPTIVHQFLTQSSHTYSYVFSQSTF